MTMAKWTQNIKKAAAVINHHANAFASAHVSVSAC
jgi:hypothetical protein